MNGVAVYCLIDGVGQWTTVLLVGLVALTNFLDGQKRNAL